MLFLQFRYELILPPTTYDKGVQQKKKRHLVFPSFSHQNCEIRLCGPQVTKKNGRMGAADLSNLSSLYAHEISTWAVQLLLQMMLRKCN